MDNSDCIVVEIATDNGVETYAAVPYEEGLTRLLEACNRYGNVLVASMDRTAAARHLREHSHPLALGCCSGSAATAAPAG